MSVQKRLYMVSKRCEYMVSEVGCIVNYLQTHRWTLRSIVEICVHTYYTCRHISVSYMIVIIIIIIINISIICVDTYDWQREGVFYDE